MSNLAFTGVLSGGAPIKAVAQSAFVVAGLSASRAAMRSISASLGRAMRFQSVPPLERIGACLFFPFIKDLAPRTVRETRFRTFGQNAD